MQDYVDAKKMKTDRPACPVFKVNIESMLDMMMKDGAQSFEDWTDLAFKLHGEGSVERSTLKRIMGHPQADRLVRAANAYLKKHVLNLTWRQSMEYQEQGLKQRETEGMYMTVTESKNWIRRIAKFNNISMNSLYENVNIVMSKAKPKINTIFLEGESNAGKSKLARSITDGFLTCGQTTRSETFMFQDLPDQQIVLIEEMRITPENVDDIKRLFEGAQMKVDIKNKDARILKRTPVIVYSNSAPEKWVIDERDALRNRMVHYKLSQFENLKNMSRDINPLAWLQFMRDLEEEYSDETVEEQITDSQETIDYNAMTDDELQDHVAQEIKENTEKMTIEIHTVDDVFAKYQTQPEDEETFKLMTQEMQQAQKNEEIKNVINNYGLSDIEWNELLE